LQVPEQNACSSESCPLPNFKVGKFFKRHQPTALRHAAATDPGASAGYRHRNPFTRCTPQYLSQSILVFGDEDTFGVPAQAGGILEICRIDFSRFVSPIHANSPGRDDSSMTHQ
jgi:hypothetical protein